MKCLYYVLGFFFVLSFVETKKNWWIFFFSLLCLFAELCDAAVRIQAAFRGHLARKAGDSDIKDDKDLQEITKKVAEELDIDLNDPELNRAATKIQATFRGHKTRKDNA